MAGPLESLGDLVSSQQLAPAVSVGLGQVFAWSGVAKATQSRQTAQALVDFRLTRVPSRTAALSLAGAEAVLAVVLIVAPLISPALTGAALAAAAVMACAFSVTIALALGRPARFPCVCFGASEKVLSPTTLLRALGLLALAGVATVSAFADATTLNAQDWLIWNVIGAGVLSILALGSRLPMLARVEDPFDFADLAMLEPSGFGPITHDHDHD